MSQVYQNTEPGGWVEFSDYASSYYSDDGTLPDDSEMKKWNENLLDGEFPSFFQDYTTKLPTRSFISLIFSVVCLDADTFIAMNSSGR